MNKVTVAITPPLPPPNIPDWFEIGYINGVYDPLDPYMYQYLDYDLPYSVKKMSQLQTIISDKLYYIITDSMSHIFDGNSLPGYFSQSERDLIESMSDFPGFDLTDYTTFNPYQVVVSFFTYMFADRTKLQDIGYITFQTYEVSQSGWQRFYFDSMFSGCTNLSDSAIDRIMLMFADQFNNNNGYINLISAPYLSLSYLGLSYDQIQRAHNLPNAGYFEGSGWYIS